MRKIKQCIECKQFKNISTVLCDACYARKQRDNNPFRRCRPHRCKWCGVLIATRQCLACLAAEAKRETAHAV